MEGLTNCSIFIRFSSHFPLKTPEKDSAHINRAGSIAPLLLSSILEVSRCNAQAEAKASGK
jgi:hypothetical protein